MEITLFAYPTFRTVPVDDLSQPGEARRIASAMAGNLSFNEVQRGQVEIIVTELAMNIVIHGGGGHVILSGQRFKNKSRMDIIAVDRGHGIANVGAALEDGFSTAGTAGTGLGAVSRLASLFEIFTQPDNGTVVLARVSDRPIEQWPLSVGGVSIPLASERACGDAFATAQSSSRSVFMVADGLGHGPEAAEAATASLEAFEKYRADSPAEIIEQLHGAMKSTRGAAVAVADIRHDLGLVTYCGIGNIAGVVLMPEDGLSRNMISHNGIVGHQMNHVAEFTYPWPPKAKLIMHSDGLNNHWNLESYPGLLNKDPALIAAVLYRDQSRKGDDATVLVAGPRNGEVKAA
ncbi:MAG: Stage sporulation protein [Acidobacteriales bacterium]|nr:Stage sporulation protein [Terriglobales bacterium]